MGIIDLMSEITERTPTEAVSYVVGALGCSRENVLSAIGSSLEEYQGWGAAGKTEYLVTELRALRTSDTVELLYAVNPKIAEWFTGCPEAVEFFIQGDLQSVVKLELLARIKVSSSSRAYVLSDDSIFGEWAEAGK